MIGSVKAGETYRFALHTETMLWCEMKRSTSLRSRMIQVEKLYHSTLQHIVSIIREVENLRTLTLWNFVPRALAIGRRACRFQSTKLFSFEEPEAASESSSEIAKVVMDDFQNEGNERRDACYRMCQHT